MEVSNTLKYYIVWDRNKCPEYNYNYIIMEVLIREISLYPDFAMYTIALTLPYH